MFIARTGDHRVERDIQSRGFAGLTCSCGWRGGRTSVVEGPDYTADDIHRRFVENAERHLAPHRPADESSALAAVREAAHDVEEADRARREAMGRLRSAIRDADRLDIKRQAIIAQAGVARQTVYDMLR